MKRSQINSAIQHAMKQLSENSIHLPMFGYWTKEDWLKKKISAKRIQSTMLGWDVTDFGSGDFQRVGAVLFTARNGDVHHDNVGTPYAEKYIMLSHEQEQAIPMHFHKNKTEDIINRGGGTMGIQVFHALEDGSLDTKSPVMVWMDGVSREVAPGVEMIINRGDSITLTPYIYHKFYAKKERGYLICGEVSSINDDKNDNVFLEIAERFCSVIEDEEMQYVLVNEYERI